MNLPFSSQIFGFAVSIVGGFFLGALYDLFRIWRALFHSGRRAVFFQDVFYLLLAALFTFLLALAVSVGEVRFYLIAGEAAGFFLYYFSFGLITVRIFRILAKFFIRFLFIPIRNIFSILCKFIKKIAIFFAKSIKKVFSKWKNDLKYRDKIVYNQHKDRRRSIRPGKEDVFKRESHSE